MAYQKDFNMQLIGAVLAGARGDSFGDALAQGGKMPDKLH